MSLAVAWLVSALLTPPAAGADDNPLYRELTGSGVTLAGASVAFPPPVLRDGMTPEAQRAALRDLVGGERALDDLLRDAVTAPQVLRLRDLPAEGGAVVRVADLWFAVHADLDAIDPAALAPRGEDATPVEVGNMRFESRAIPPAALAARGIDPAEGRGWYSHATARLLDRLHVESTSRTLAVRSPDALYVAFRTDRAFDADAEYPNRWWPIGRRAGKDVPGEPRPYDGGAGVVAARRLAFRPDALLVEVHFAFAEPEGWFDGAPILRSKIGLVAQDRIRALRRELEGGAGRRASPLRRAGGMH